MGPLGQRFSINNPMPHKYSNIGRAVATYTKRHLLKRRHDALTNTGLGNLDPHRSSLPRRRYYLSACGFPQRLSQSTPTALYIPSTDGGAHNALTACLPKKQGGKTFVLAKIRTIFSGPPVDLPRWSLESCLNIHPDATGWQRKASVSVCHFYASAAQPSINWTGIMS